jgi:hypothetical protein
MKLTINLEISSSHRKKNALAEVTVH